MAAQLVGPQVKKGVIRVVKPGTPQSLGGQPANGPNNGSIIGPINGPSNGPIIGPINGPINDI